MGVHQENTKRLWDLLTHPKSNGRLDDPTWRTDRSQDRALRLQVHTVPLGWEGSFFSATHSPKQRLLWGCSPSWPSGQSSSKRAQSHVGTRVRMWRGDDACCAKDAIYNYVNFYRSFLFAKATCVWLLGLSAHSWGLKSALVGCAEETTRDHQGPDWRYENKQKQIEELIPTSEALILEEMRWFSSWCVLAAGQDSEGLDAGPTWQALLVRFCHVFLFLNKKVTGWIGMREWSHSTAGACDWQPLKVAIH